MFFFFTGVRRVSVPCQLVSSSVQQEVKRNWCWKNVLIQLTWLLLGKKPLARTQRTHSSNYLQEKMAAWLSIQISGDRPAKNTNSDGYHQISLWKTKNKQELKMIH